MAQMAVSDHDMIGAFPADRADQPVCVRVLPGVKPERRRAVSNADRLNVADKYPSDVERTLLTQSGPKAMTIRSASSRKFLAVCAYGSMRTPGLSMPCGSNSRLAALSAAAKSSGRCRSYQDL